MKTTYLFSYFYTSRILRTPVCGGMRAQSEKQVRKVYERLAQAGTLVITNSGGKVVE